MTEHFDDNEMIFGDYETERDNLTRQPEPGVYEIVLKKWEPKTSKEKNTPGVNWVFGIQNAENPEDNGFPLYHWTGWGTRFFRQVVIAVAGPAITNAKLSSEEVMSGSCEFLDSLVGATVNVELSARKYQGEDRIQISKFIM